VRGRKNIFATSPGREEGIVHKRRTGVTVSAETGPHVTHEKAGEITQALVCKPLERYPLTALLKEKKMIFGV